MIRIAVTSLKGGAGVTALVSGLAQAAAGEGLDVVCIEPEGETLLKHHLALVALSDDGEGSSGNTRITLRAGETWAAATTADVVLFDLPRAYANLRNEIADGADAVVLVVTASASSLVLAPAVKTFLAGGDNRFLLINFDDGRVALKRASAAFLEAQFADRMIGRVRQDESVEEAVASLEMLSTVAPYSAAWTDIRVAFVNLLNRMNSLPIAAAQPK